MSRPLNDWYRNAVRFIGPVTALLLLSAGCTGTSFSSPKERQLAAAEWLSAFDEVDAVEATQYTQAMLKRLSLASATAAKLKLVRAARPVALSVAGTILLSTSVVCRSSSESELAFVLAHELAHIKRGEETFSDLTTEMEADKEGLIIVSAAGYDALAAERAILRHSNQDTEDDTQRRLLAVRQKAAQLPRRWQIPDERRFRQVRVELRC